MLKFIKKWLWCDKRELEEAGVCVKGEGRPTIADLTREPVEAAVYDLHVLEVRPFVKKIGEWIEEGKFRVNAANDYEFKNGLFFLIFYFDSFALKDSYGGTEIELSAPEKKYISQAVKNLERRKKEKIIKAIEEAQQDEKQEIQ